MDVCEFCGSPLSELVCTKCEAPRAMPAPAPDFFSLFHLNPTFALDELALTKRYYELSSLLHPDRFSGRGNAEWTQRAEDWMSLVNEAYQTLKAPAKRRGYLLNLLKEGIEPKAAPKLPAELSEEWFTLQDLLLDDLTAAMEGLKTFEAKVAAENEALASEIAAIERAWDETLDKKHLAELGDAMKRKAYVASLAHNIERTRHSIPRADA